MDYEKKYKEAINRAKAMVKVANSQEEIYNSVITIFPELKESEDKMIREYLIRYIDNTMKSSELKSKLLAWLEKQGEQDNNEDSNILQRFSFYSYKDESNILYLSGLYVNGECRNKGIGTKILEVADEVAKNLNCYAIRLKTEIGSNAERLYRRNGYNTFKREGNNVWLEKQGEQNPAWSEEDIFKVQRICKYLDEAKKYYADITEVRECMEWLKSLKERVQPQPKQEWSEEDQNALEDVREAVVHYWSGETQDILLYWLKSIKQRMGG